MSGPADVWQQLRAGNEHLYIPTVRSRDASTAGDAAAGPIAVVFRCADAGVSSEVVFGHSSRSIIDVSTWGHTVDAGVLATIEHAVDDLRVPLIVVLGHHQCEAMQTAQRAWTDAAMPDGATRIVVEQATSSMMRSTIGTATVDDVETGHVVETALSLLQRSPTIARTVDSGQCAIVAAITEPTDGRITVWATIGNIAEPNDHLLECL